jgi:hypothetical protein
MKQEVTAKKVFIRSFGCHPKVLAGIINKASPNFKSCWEISHEMHSISPAQKFGMAPINRSGEKL